MSDKRVNYSHGLAQTKQQVSQCIVGTLLVHGGAMNKHRFTRFITAWTWGKPSSSPLQYFLCLATGPRPKCHFVPRLPSWEFGNLEIFEMGTFATLQAHDFLWRLLIEMRFEVKLQPSPRAFQKFMTHHLNVSKSGRFLTFSGQEPNL